MIAHEDIIMQGVLIAREHLVKQIEHGYPFFINTSPVAVQPVDVLALSVLEYMLLVNEHDMQAVLSNLDDIRMFAPLMHVSDAVVYQPLLSTNAQNDCHLDPQGYSDLLASLGYEAESLLDIHYRVDEAYWWAVYITKVTVGTIDASRVQLVDMTTDEEE